MALRGQTCELEALQGSPRTHAEKRQEFNRKGRRASATIALKQWARRLEREKPVGFSARILYKTDAQECVGLTFMKCVDEQRSLLDQGVEQLDKAIFIIAGKLAVARLTTP